MKRINKISAVIYLLFVLHASYGQNNITREFNVTPVTPDAAALAKMVNYPVNHNTGIPNISIPLYEIKTGGMTLPIELNYHSGGFKINEQAGRAGLGWSLSCDLQITRTINDLDDFGSGGYIRNTRMKQANKNYNTYNDPYAYPMDLDNKYYLATGTFDGMPDKFYYKLLNKSGAFFFQKNTSGNSYTIVPVPYDNIKIEFDTDGSFIITDTDGTTYYFGYPGTIDVDYLAQYGIEVSGNSQSLKRAAWKCMRIDNPNRTESITFTYGKLDQRKTYVCKDKIEYWKTFMFSLPSNYGPHYANELMFNGITFYGQLLDRCPFYQLSSPKYMEHYGGEKAKFHLPYFDGNQVVDNIYSVDGVNTNTSTLIEGLKLTKITYRGGQVEFEGNALLETIKITDNREVKRIRLFQSYKTPVNLTQAQLYNGSSFKGTNYLDSIRIGDDKYTLMYPEKYCFGSHLIRHDAWGYVNEQTYERGQYDPQTLGISRQRKTIKHKTANITKSFYIGGSNILVEQPSEQHMRKGILKRIVYPTGGFVDFDFEANKYEEIYDGIWPERNIVLRNGGGLRIRSINYYTGDSYSASMQKYYRYGDYEEGAGQMADVPAVFSSNGSDWDYKGYQYTQIINYSNANHLQLVGTPVKDSLTVYLPASALDYTYANGAPAYYRKVTEYQADMGSQTGKTVYKYYPRNYFFDDYHWTQMIPETNIPYIKVDWHLGALESVAEYKYTEGQYQLRHLKKNDYHVFQKNERPRVVYSFPYDIHKVINGTYEGDLSGLYSFLASQYNLSVGKLLLSKETEKWLENANDTIIQTTNYYYDNSAYLQPSRILKTHSSGSQTITLKYPYDETGVYLEMKNANIISPVIQETIKDNATNSEISKLRINYRKDGEKFVRANIESSVQGKSLTEELRFDLYDQYENVLQTTSHNLTVKSFLWGYQGRYLVAEIENASYTTASALLNMGIISNPSSESAIKTELEKLHQMSYAMVNAYTYQPLTGICRYISPQKRHTTYEYDTYGRLKAIYDNDQKLVKAFNYKTRKSTSISNGLFYTNLPRMESFNKNCGTSQMGIYNYIGLGGQGATSYTEEPYPLNGRYEGSKYDVCAPASGFVKITFEAIMLKKRDVVFDFIKDGSIVATKTFECYANNEPANNLDFYLPVGEYNVVLRPGVLSYTERYIAIYLTSSSGERGRFTSKNKINFQSGYTYNISVSDTF